MKVFLLVIALLAVLAAAPNGARADSAAHAVWPLDPRPIVARRFDPPDSPWASGHRGVDLLGQPGQPVRSALAGTVTFAGIVAGRGVVVVDHGATRTTYEPVAATVAVGTVVPAGGTLGRLQGGLSHCAPRTCLHWGLLRGEQYLDPLSLLGLAPLRLLPILGPSVLGPTVLAPAGLAPAGLVPSGLRLWGVPAGRPFAAARP